jgi:hypothetical protein
LKANQVNDIFPPNGPETGGTPIGITLDINQTETNIGDVSCKFPGNEIVEATATPPFDFICITPELTEDIDGVTSYETHALLDVEIIMSEETVKNFRYLMNKNVTIYGFEPPYAMWDQARTIIVKGNNFVNYNSPKWKLLFQTPIIVDAVYYNDKGFKCDIPSLDPVYAKPYSLPIEISLNDGIDYTDVGASYTYIDRDKINTLVTTAGTVKGNTDIEIIYDSFYNALSSRSQWVFELPSDPTKFFRTKIISNEVANK